MNTKVDYIFEGDYFPVLLLRGHLFSVCMLKIVLKVSTSDNCSLVRTIMDYNSVVFHLQITRIQNILCQVFCHQWKSTYFILKYV